MVMAMYVAINVINESSWQYQYRIQQWLISS